MFKVTTIYIRCASHLSSDPRYTLFVLPMSNMAPVYVLITGANSGIGYETVKTLLQHDQAYHIFLTALAISDAQQSVDQLQQVVPNSSSSLQPIELDITDDDSISRASDIVSRVTDRLDVLVNNAGTLVPQKADVL